LFEGEDLVQKSEAEMQHIRGKRIAMILQDPMVSLNPLFTIGDQVAEPIRVHEGASRASAWSRACELLRAVRIPAPETRLTQYPHEMSGGMRQRIVGAIGIACEPRLLIADEPTTSLDLTIQAQYLKLLHDLQQAHGLALIFITHNLGIVAKMCDKLAVMYAGRVVESGPVSRIFNAPAHPYTRALLSAIPGPESSTRRSRTSLSLATDTETLVSGGVCLSAFVTRFSTIRSSFAGSTSATTGIVRTSTARPSGVSTPATACSTSAATSVRSTLTGINP